MKSGDRIVYQGEDVLPMQRWNNIIINYNTKQMDVFINGKLLKTIKNVIPNDINMKIRQAARNVLQ